MLILMQVGQVVDETFNAVSETVFGVLFVSLAIVCVVAIYKLWKSISQQHEQREDKLLDYHETREDKLREHHKVRETKLMEHLGNTTEKLSDITQSIFEINNSVQNLNDTLDQNRKHHQKQREKLNEVSQTVGDIEGLLGRRYYDNRHREWETHPRPKKENDKKGDSANG